MPLPARFLSFFAPVLAALGVAAPAVPPAMSLAEVRSWAVYYGEAAASEALASPDLLVLEPDHAWDPPAMKRQGQRILAYLSLGEVHKTRPYYPQLAALPGAVLGPNPDWPGAMRVDPRSPAWRKMVLEQLTGGILARGYDGFFFDTLDVAADMERGGKAPGAKAAMISLLMAIHTRHPEAILLANGGLDLLPDAAPALSGVAVESIYTDYQFKQKRYQWREENEAAVRAQSLQAIGTRDHLALLGIEYVDPTNDTMRGQAAAKMRAGGFVPFVGDIGLGTLQAAPVEPAAQPLAQP